MRSLAISSIRSDICGEDGGKKGLNFVFSSRLRCELIYFLKNNQEGAAFLCEKPNNHKKQFDSEFDSLIFICLLAANIRRF